MVTNRQIGLAAVRILRSIDRAAKRAERQRIANQIAVDKLGVREAAAESVRKYEKLVESLTGAHRINFVRRDWLAIASLQKSADPERTHAEEDAATAALDNYHPGLLARTLGFGNRRRKNLINDIEVARNKDKINFSARQKMVETRNEEIELAEQLLRQDRDATVIVLSKYSCLGQLPFSVEGVKIIFSEDGRIIAMVDGLDIDDVPSQSFSLLKSGNLSIKPLNKARIFEMHRDNICSSAIRVAAELLCWLPVESAEVVMNTDMLDEGSGHIHGWPVLYLRATAQALSSVNLVQAEPAALVYRLGGHLDWNKRYWFRAIALTTFGIDAELLQDE